MEENHFSYEVIFVDDGSTDIDSLDAFEYTIERDMKMLIQEAEDV